jgi:hypothetical protein
VVGVADSPVLIPKKRLTAVVSLVLTSACVCGQPKRTGRRADRTPPVPVASAPVDPTLPRPGAGVLRRRCRRYPGAPVSRVAPLPRGRVGGAAAAPPPRPNAAQTVSEASVRE